ncbi:MAG: adenylosuccinate lyase, partial [Methanomicrobiales archaeon]|nr:adenylosuccinate lyase [Methanomicrobiales archaeon]
ALQNNTLWDERDLTNSSCERVILPEATILTDHILQVMTRVLEGLTIHRKNVRKNLELLGGVPLAESVMVELTRRGMGRQEAHEVLRESSMKALAGGKTLASVLGGNREVTALLSSKEIEILLDPDRYIGTAPAQVDRLVARLSRLCAS